MSHNSGLSYFFSAARKATQDNVDSQPQDDTLLQLSKYERIKLVLCSVQYVVDF
jgi:hypothetical protein